MAFKPPDRMAVYNVNRSYLIVVKAVAIAWYRRISPLRFVLLTSGSMSLMRLIKVFRLQAKIDNVRLKSIQKKTSNSHS